MRLRRFFPLLLEITRKRLLHSARHAFNAVALRSLRDRLDGVSRSHILQDRGLGAFGAGSCFRVSPYCPPPGRGGIWSAGKRGSSSSRMASW